jgi:N-acetylneuraminic acid mutarotase
MSGNAALGYVFAAAMILAAVFTAPAALAQQPPGMWSMEASLPQGRDEVQAATVGGKIYLVGGAWTETKDGRRIEHYTEGFMSEYDSKTDHWRERTRAPEGLTHQGIAVLGGKIYLAGGFAGGRHSLSSAGVYSYDPATDQWKTLAPLSAPRGAVALAAAGGLIHAIGGRIIGEENTLAIHEVYNPATNSWGPAAALPIARDHAGVFVVDGKVHLIGGRTGEATANVGLHDVYDPATDKWTSALPMPTPRSSGAFADYRGLLFFAGGECRTGAGAKTYDEVEAYDTKGDRWLKFASLPTPRHGFAAAVADDKLFFIAGSGRCGGGGMMADTLELSLR